MTEPSCPRFLGGSKAIKSRSILFILIFVKNCRCDFEEN